MAHKLILATIDPEAPALAEQYDLGLELDEFCTAANMDAPAYADWDAKVRPLLNRAEVFHAPFAELYPCAIDPQVRDIAKRRLKQAARLAEGYGIRRVVFHGNFQPWVYFPEWFTEQSVGFWRDFLSEQPQTMQFCLENVLEPEPELLRDVVAAVDDPRLRLCLDLGHAQVRRVSRTPLRRWIQICAPYLAHVHLHDNDSVWDEHLPLGSGAMNVSAVLGQLCAQAPMATITLEHPVSTERSLRRLLKTYAVLIGGSLPVDNALR